MKEHIPVVEHILSANDRIAAQNRTLLDENGVFAINLMASPGAGKTSLILKTFELLHPHVRIGMVDGDLASSIDAQKAQDKGITAVQINTGGNCHLDSVMLQFALAQIEFSEIDLLLVENVGNLVCPANFKLGTHKNILIASIPEGDDKPYKYPGMYRGVDALVINKIDLLPYIHFNMEYFQTGVEILNPGLITFPVSCTTGEGLPAWANWLQENIHV
ncbi:MAG: hydrogenase nickel incorporation protein HypB [Anaerolineae bacterium]|nr:hydrogenase nickel incorporation protein HypB [Anaerolineae bacterium]